MPLRSLSARCVNLFDRGNEKSIATSAGLLCLGSTGIVLSRRHAVFAVFAIHAQ